MYLTVLGVDKKVKAAEGKTINRRGVDAVYRLLVFPIPKHKIKYFFRYHFKSKVLSESSFKRPCFIDLFKQ